MSGFFAMSQYAMGGTMLHDLLYGACALVGWVSFVYKLRHLRNDWHNPALRAICAAFGFCALGFTLVTGIVFRPLDDLMGIPNLTKLLVHGSIVLFSAYVLRLLALWLCSNVEARRRARLPIILGFATVGAMTVLILLAQIHNQYTIHFWKSFAGQTYMVWYLTIFLISITVGVLAIGHHSWKCAMDRTLSSWLRRGLCITAIGAYISLGYCICRGTYLVGLQAGLRMDLLVDLAQPFISVGQILCFVGLTMPSWGPYFRNRKVRRGQLVSHRSLFPLWFALYQAFPAIALHPPPVKRKYQRERMRDAYYLLYRRMIEIRDGLLLLRPYLKSHQNSDLGAAVEAERIHQALSALFSDQSCDSSPGMVEALSSGTIEATGGNAEADELAWLIAVSRAFARLSPLSDRRAGRPRTQALTHRP